MLTQVKEENSLGWRLARPRAETGKIVEKGNSFFIAKLGKREKSYCLNAFPRLSREEERLLAQVAALFQKKQWKADRKSLRKFFKVI